MSEQYNKLIRTLQTIFEMDKADLDFGIYRIMNQKRDEINRFLREDLLSQVNSAFDRYKSSGQDDLQQELADAIELAKKYGASDPEEADAVKEVRAKIDAAVDTVALENEVYSHLHKFFSRYYDQGDFISKRRYKADTYAIPYEGEEVKLYWANYDQYYIKSSEHLRDYAFTIPTKDEEGEEKSVRIKLVEADTEKDNVKAKSGEERRFILDEEAPLSVEDGELYIHFRFEPDPEKRPQTRAPGSKSKNKSLNEIAVETIFLQEYFTEWLELLKLKAPTDNDPDRTLLEKHLKEYTDRNTFDYFIHKDLGGFLRRELDFYIKNEVMFLDDIGNVEDDKAQEEKAFAITEQQIRKIKVIRTIAEKIIQMLAQLEDFQKKLWLKKKFVVETNYCITLDRVPVELYGQIADCSEQHAEWVSLGFTAEDTKITEGYLKDNPYLVLDTKFFGDEFKLKLLASINNIDEQSDGLLINSDNFHAINCIGSTFKNSIDCIYIDPPYNSPSSKILYKNNFMHSSWLSMMDNRVSISKNILSDNGSYVIAIDENEINGLHGLVLNNFPEYDVTVVTVQHNKKGIQGDHFSFSNEFAIFAIPYSLKYLNSTPIPPDEWEYSNLRNWGTESLRVDAKNCFYPVIVRDNKIVGFGDLSPEDYHPESANIKTDDGAIEIYPIDSKGIERKWRYARHTVEKIEDIIRLKTERNGMLTVEMPKTDEKFKTLWDKPEYIAGDYGTKVLTQMGFDSGQFDFSKSVNTVKDSIFAVSNENSIVFDFFAGSGTTAHAVIKLNSEDGGSRKYILAEMGDHFDSVIMPRIKKITYSSGWKEGKPVEKHGFYDGASHCFKYIRLESYEDTLNNLMLRDPSKQQQDMLEESGELREEYMLGYWMDLETAGSPSLLNIEQFEDPFNYTLNIGKGSVGATKPTKVDLVETFNYLLVLTVRQIDTIRGFKVIIGANPKEESVAVIWRNSKEKSNEDLEAFLDKQSYNPRDTEYDHIYVNGDHTLEDPHSKVKMIEIEFKRLMFEME